MNELGFNWNTLAPAREGTAGILDQPPPFLEFLPVAIYACDVHGRVLWFNRKAQDLWGRAPRTWDDCELFCGAFRLLLNGREIRRSETPMADVLRTGNAVHGQTVVIERPDGSRVTVMVHIDPVKESDGRILGAINCFHDISQQKLAEERLQASEQRLRDLLEALPAAIYTTDAAGRITFYNQAAAEFWGHRPKLGESQWCGSWRLFWPDERPLRHEDCPMAMALKENRPIRNVEAIVERPDGSRFPFLPFPTPLHDEDGRLVGAVNMLVDISERKQSETRLNALIDELNHRVKNTLATVQSLATHTLRGDGISPQALQLFSARLHALSKAHDQLSREHWRAADIRLVASEVCSPYAADGRLHTEGPAVSITPRAALSLAMIFNELATNAAKYGALSTPEGAVSLSWDLVSNGHGRQLVLHWRESGGPPVKKPSRYGFGTRLIERAIAHELDGSADLRYDRSGLQCHLEFPLGA